VPKGEYLQYGGQAIIEGVMMRSPRFFSVAVRAPNGQIVLQTEALEKTWIGRQKWLRFPFLRGSLALLDAMALGIRAMHFASNVQMDPHYEQKQEADSVTAEGTGVIKPNEHGGDSIRKIAVGSTMVFGILIGLFLFVFLPNVIGEQLRRVGVVDPTILNVVSGLFKLVVFLTYIFLVSRMKEIHRVFQYHGAEHKAINTLEAEEELNMENCRKQTRLHPRCGTSFAIIVLLIDIVILTFIPRYLLGEGVPVILNLLARFGVNVLILPIIAGIAYELIKFAGKFRHSGFIMALFAPGLMTQYITTAEPTDDQIEVALEALRAVLASEGKQVEELELKAAATPV
jgi:uncharacterized protein YqhQ